MTVCLIQRYVADELEVRWNLIAQGRNQSVQMHDIEVCQREECDLLQGWGAA